MKKKYVSPEIFIVKVSQDRLLEGSYDNIATSKDNSTLWDEQDEEGSQSRFSIWE